MGMDNWTTAPGNLNPPRRPEHIDQRPRHPASFAATLLGRPPGARWAAKAACPDWCKRWCLHQSWTLTQPHASRTQTAALGSPRTAGPALRARAIFFWRSMRGGCGPPVTTPRRRIPRVGARELDAIPGSPLPPPSRPYGSLRLREDHANP